MQACLQEDFLPFPTSGDVHSPNTDLIRFLCEHKSASRNAGVNCKNSIHQHGQKEQEKVKSCKNRGKYAIIKNDTRIRYHFPAQAGMILTAKVEGRQLISIPRVSGAFLLFQIDKTV